MLLLWRLHRFTPKSTDELKDWWPRLRSAAPGTRRKELNTLACCTLRMIWLERNSRVFNKVASMPSIVTMRVSNEITLWMLARVSGSVDDNIRTDA